MKIILEGPEASGKSTLAESLSNSTGYPIIHRDKPKNEEEKQKMMYQYSVDVTTNNNQIWDRCWYSEMVYGPVMRDQSYIGVEQMLELERWLQACGGAIIIHCTDATENLWARSQIRGEDYITDYATLARIKVGYESLFHRTQHVIPVVRYELGKSMSWM